MKAAIVPVTPLQQNCTLIWCEKTNKGAVVDPGGDLDRIEAAIEETGMELEKILVTHAHLDHVGAVADLAERTGVPIEGPHEADQFWIDQLPEQGEAYGMGRLKTFTPDRWLKGGDSCTVGDETFQVFHCPGHTPGHVVFFNEPNRLVLVGDVLFKGSIGRTDFPKGDTAALYQSIRDSLLPLGDDVTFIPGHGPPSTIGDERRTNPYVAEALALGGDAP